MGRYTTLKRASLIFEATQINIVKSAKGLNSNTENTWPMRVEIKVITKCLWGPQQLENLPTGKERTGGFLLARAKPWAQTNLTGVKDECKTGAGRATLWKSQNLGLVLR